MHHYPPKTAASELSRAGHALHSALLRSPRIERVEDISRYPAFAGWPAADLHAAVDELVDAGLLTEACDGRLCIHRRAVG